MTLDEAIVHAEEQHEKQKLKSAWCRLHYKRKEAEQCETCAEEHKQLAEWLRELKEWRKGGKL